MGVETIPSMAVRASVIAETTPYEDVAAAGTELSVDVPVGSVSPFGQDVAIEAEARVGTSVGAADGRATLDRFQATRVADVFGGWGAHPVGGRDVYTSTKVAAGVRGSTGVGGRVRLEASAGAGVSRTTMQTRADVAFTSDGDSSTPWQFRAHERALWLQPYAGVGGRLPIGRNVSVALSYRLSGEVPLGRHSQATLAAPYEIELGGSPRDVSWWFDSDPAERRVEHQLGAGVEVRLR